MFNSLVSNGHSFGARSWLAVFVWVIVLACGYYLYQMWRERNPVRVQFMQRLGLGMLIASGVGLALMVLRVPDIAVISWPLWSYLAMLGTLAFLGWAAWFYTQKLPALAATSGRQVAGRGAPVARAGTRSSGNSGGGARTYTTPTGPPVRSEPRPVATTTRREARRDRKRKSR